MAEPTLGNAVNGSWVQSAKEGQVSESPPASMTLTQPASDADGTKKLLPDASLQESKAYATEPRPRITYRIEYHSVVSSELVFSKDTEGPSAENLDRSQPAFEVVTIAYTQEPSTKSSNDQTTSKPPPITLMGNSHIIIKSPAVINALRTVITYYPSENLSGNSITIPEPYAMIVHYEKALLEYREHFAPSATMEDSCKADAHTYEDLGILLDFVKDRLGDSAYKERQRHAKEQPTATFQMLWTLFKPGIDVYYDHNEDGELNGFVVKSVSWTLINGCPNSYVFTLWNLDCNSTYVGASGDFTVTIGFFSGEKAISSLRLFPCKYLRKDMNGASHEEKKQYLERRGQKWFHLQKKQCRWFNGLSTTWPRRSVSMGPGLRRAGINEHQFTGFVMVDMVQFMKPDENGNSFPDPHLAEDVENSIVSMPTCFCRRCTNVEDCYSKEKAKFAGYSKINPLKTTTLTPHQYFLCNYSMKGFLIKLREWSE